MPPSAAREPASAVASGRALTVHLVLPVYNEIAALPTLLTGFVREMERAGLPGRILAVDDGSTDGSRPLLREFSARLPITTVEHAENRGLGETIQDGLRAAVERAHPDDVIVTMDADNTQPLDLIPAMVARLEQGAEVVIASRYRPGARVEGLSGFREGLSHGARWAFQLAFPTPGVRDYTSGFRAYRAGTLQRLFDAYDGRLVTQRGFACMAEILLKLRRLGVPMAEVPMVLRYDRKGGASKMRVGLTVWKTLGLILRNRIRPAR